MTIPFLDIFKKATSRFWQNSEAVAVPAAVPRAAHPEKPSGDRLSKTVMPNTIRPSKPDAFKEAADSAPNIKLPVARPTQLPPSVALALQPKVERAISLQLGDILDQLPEGHVKPVESFDPAQRILLKASEIEKGMATGKPTVSLATIYEQVPEIFLRNVPAGDTTQIGLPFAKVMDQFQKVQVRSDQEQEFDVPQLDTPILQVTLEDTQRFGTTLQTIQTSANPPVRVEPATARTLSSAEPEPASRETFAMAARPKGIPLNISTSPTAAPPSRPSVPDPSSPTRIPFHLPPNGAGGSASERVPASSEPPVPTPAPKSDGPARIPFKISASCNDLKPQLTLIPGVATKTEKSEEPAAATAELPVGTDKISLGLRAVLQNMPAFQLNGSPDAVATDVQIDLPLALVQSQLASGRIAISTKAFRDALPENHRELVVVDESESPVLLPLQEVLKNLPSAVLKMRDDQEEGDATASFETPFSIKAAEDAKRLGAASAVESKAESASTKVDLAPASTIAKQNDVAVAPKTEISTSVVAPKPLEPAKLAKASEIGTRLVAAPSASLPTRPEESVQKVEANLEANTNAKGMVARVSRLPGVTGCSITFEDGLSLAGDLPEDVQVGGLCAMAPSVLKRIDRHTADTKLGSLRSMTLHCEESQMSFFMKGNVCLTVLHAGGDLAPDTHNKLAEMAKELSRTYSQPETVHVDH
jgi:predicted regulator of Ras-like GTPase activity (Roadblock/LC7/MglB family)